MKEWRRQLLRIGQLVAAVLLLVAGAGGAAAQDPSQVDNSGKGAVLCAWSIYASIQVISPLCGVERQPLDDAIDEVMPKIEAFILKNTTLGITQARLDGYKRRLKEQSPIAQSCRDLGMFRSMSAEQVRAGVDDLLSLPREPVWNPCI